MFIGSKVNHKKYGEGVIKNLEVKPNVSELNSLVTIEFNSGEVKKFPISIFGKINNFATLEDEEAISYIQVLEEEFAKKKLEEKIKAKEAREAKVYIPSYNLDEVEREVKKEDWERAAKVAEVHRFPNESRAVVMDSDLVFINASAAMRYIEARVKDCDKIYKSCDLRNNKFMNHFWSYASKENINAIIKKLEEEEN